MADYHGPKPVTEDDLEMAKEHLKETYKLNKDKIKDHKDALKRAEDKNDGKSASYNKSHLSGHQDDNKQIERSMNTVNSMDKSDTYNDVRKKKVAIMEKKAKC